MNVDMEVAKGERGISASGAGTKDDDKKHALRRTELADW